MATELLSICHTPGKTVYFSIWDSSSTEKVFDFADNTFKLLSAPPTTPYLAAAEQTARGGVAESGYTANLNLSLINAAAAIKEFEVEAYEQAGGSPSLTADTMLDTAELRVSAGAIATGATPGGIVRLDANVTSTSGTSVQLVAWVEVNGQAIVLDATASCSIVCREFGAGSGVNLFTINDGGSGPSTGDGLTTFELTQNSPGYTDDRQYVYNVTIVNLGTTYAGKIAIPAIGGQ